MALRTRNSYGTIAVSDDVIASLAGHFAAECYGVVELVPFGFSDSFSAVSYTHLTLPTT